MTTPRDDESIIDERTHERLCAWILGEVCAGEARELEAACAASPALRAERARLESTIGLVRGAYDGQPALSDAAMARVMAAAGRAGTTPGPRATGGPAWWQRPALRAAAAVTALIGGVLGVLALQGDGAATTDVALVDQPVPLETRSNAVSSSEQAQAPRDRVERQRKQAQDPQAEGDPGAAHGAVDGSTLDQEIERPTLGATLNTEGVKVSGRTITEFQAAGEERDGLPTEDAVRALGQLGDKAGRVDREALSRADLEKATADRNAKPVEGGVRTGADDFYLGRGQADGAASGEAGKSLEGKRRAGEPEFRPASGGGAGAAAGPTPPGPAGPPASDAPARPAQNQPATGSVTSGLDRRAGGRGRHADGEVVDQLEQLMGEDLSGQALKGLGYAGGEGLDEEQSVVRLRAGRQLSLKDLPEAELRVLTDRYADDFFRRCARRPQERPRDMFFRFWGDNPFEYTPQDAQSTFSIDVDTASYVLARRYLNEGHLPEKAQVRTEEFVNFFDADLTAPSEETFAIHTELAPSRFGGVDGRWMLRVGLRGKQVRVEERAPLSLTFVVDVSGSMREGQRLELVKHALRLLVTQLDARDSIALVAFSNEAREVLPMTPAAQRARIEAAIHPLAPGGGTNAEAGLKLGYELAQGGLDPNTHSRVILLSDGVANIGQTDQDRIGQDVRRQRERGVYLNTVGVGMNNHNDVFLEQLADKGDGVCDYVDGPQAVERALVERFTGALVPIASDVKVQVEFDKDAVARYRLLGYENRAIADLDFRNDAVDAGEVGAGHQVTALYELELLPAAELDRLATVRLRWKEPKRAGQHPLEVQVSEREQPVRYADALAAFASASPGYRRSVLVAQFAEFLRRSTHAAGDSLQELIAEAGRLAPVLADDDFTEFVGLVRRAEPMLVAERLRELQDELGMTVHEYRDLLYKRAVLEELEELEGRSQILEQIREANERIESEIRELIYRDLRQGR